MHAHVALKELATLLPRTADESHCGERSSILSVNVSLSCRRSTP